MIESATAIPEDGVTGAGAPPASAATKRCSSRPSRVLSQRRAGARSNTRAVTFDSFAASWRLAWSSQPFQPGYAHEMNASRRESGSQRGAKAPPGTDVTRRASPPSTGMT